jgi:hypothetical protein
LFVFAQALQAACAFLINAFPFFANLILFCLIFMVYNKTIGVSGLSGLA